MWGLLVLGCGLTMVAVGAFLWIAANGSRGTSRDRPEVGALRRRAAELSRVRRDEPTRGR